MQGSVQERIFTYLLGTGTGAAADQILSDVLNIHSPNVDSASRVLSGFLEGDPRFVCTGGVWHLRPQSSEPVQFSPGHVVVLHLQEAHGLDALQVLRGAVRLADGALQELVSPVPPGLLSRLQSDIDGHLLIIWSDRELQLWNRLLRSNGLEAWRGDRLCLRNLARRALKRTSFRLQPADLASELGLSPVDEERPRAVAEYLNWCWLLLLDRVSGEFQRSLELLRGWIQEPPKRVDFNRFAFGPDFLRQLPKSPGLYLMKNRSGAIIYVGKSRNLRRRVSSYFTPRALSDPKTVRIHRHLHSIDVFTTENEIEALLMEMRMIQDFAPPINLQTEIHESRAEYTGRDNLLFFVAEEEKNRVQIYFLRDGVFAGRLAAPLGRAPSKRLLARVKSLFFRQGGKARKGGTGEKELVSRWFTANRRRLNYLDVDQAGSFESVLERLSHYLCDPDRLTKKVYYR